MDEFYVFREINRLKEENQLIRKQLADEQAMHSTKNTTEGK
jgi:hypothetical protein